jgi:hypothetical protein
MINCFTSEHDLLDTFAIVERFHVAAQYDSVSGPILGNSITRGWDAEAPMRRPGIHTVRALEVLDGCSS